MSKKSFADLTDQDRALFAGAATRLINCIPCGYAGLCPVTRSVRNLRKLIWVTPLSLIAGLIGGFGLLVWAASNANCGSGRLPCGGSDGEAMLVFLIGFLPGFGIAYVELYPPAKSFVLCPACRTELGPVD